MSEPCFLIISTNNYLFKCMLMWLMIFLKNGKSECSLENLVYKTFFCQDMILFLPI